MQPLLALTLCFNQTTTLSYLYDLLVQVRVNGKEASALKTNMD